MSYSSEEQQWIKFYNKMAAGDIPYNPDLYFVDEKPVQEGCGASVQLVSPTEAQVNQARMQLKRKILGGFSKIAAKVKRRITRPKKKDAAKRKQKIQKGRAKNRKAPKKKTKKRSLKKK